MKKYQQDIKPEGARGTALPIYPEFAACDPVFEGNAIVTSVYLWYDCNGKYLGWTGRETTRKFLMGKLYYKTKGAFRMKTTNNWASDRNVGEKDIFIIEKATSRYSAYVRLRYVSKFDLIDMSDRAVTIPAAIEEIKAFQMNNYNYASFPNSYKIIPDEFRAKFNRDFNEFLIAKKQELLNHCNAELNVLNTYKDAESSVELELSNLIR